MISYRAPENLSLNSRILPSKAVFYWSGPILGMKFIAHDVNKKKSSKEMCQNLQAKSESIHYIILNVFRCFLLKMNAQLLECLSTPFPLSAIFCFSTPFLPFFSIRFIPLRRISTIFLTLEKKTEIILFYENNTKTKSNIFTSGCGTNRSRTIRSVQSFWQRWS